MKQKHYRKVAILNYLYCTRCKNQLTYKGEGQLVCPHCKYIHYYPSLSEDSLELYSKAEWYQKDGQYFNALQMYEIVIKSGDASPSAYFGAILAKYGAEYKDLHDGSYDFVCERTFDTDIYTDPLYKKLIEVSPKEAIKIYEPIIDEISKEQKNNIENYKIFAPIDDKKDYRAEAREQEAQFADEYLISRQKYLEEERQREEEAQEKRRRIEEAEEAAKLARKRRADAEIKREKRKKAIKITALILAVAAIFSLISFGIVIPAAKYSIATKAIKEGNYDKAATILRTLGSYKDSSSLLMQYRFFGLEQYDTVTFGSYEQDANSANGKENIEWIVLKVTDDTVTLMSKYVLDCVQYNENNNAPSYWVSCTLRQWLNNDFVNSAFDNEQSTYLKGSENENPDNKKCGTKGCENTVDLAHCLSIDEAKLYLNGDINVGYATAYAKSKGIYDKSENGGTFWWLRSSGSSQNCAAKVNCDGNVDERGSGVNFKSYGVRPVITVTKSTVK